MYGYLALTECVLTECIIPIYILFASYTDIFHLKVDMLRQKVGNYNQPSRNEDILRDTSVSQSDYQTIEAMDTKEIPENFPRNLVL